MPVPAEHEPELTELGNIMIWAKIEFKVSFLSTDDGRDGKEGLSSSLSAVRQHGKEAYQCTHPEMLH